MVLSSTDLGVKLINQFLTSKKVKKGPDHMLTIHKAKWESLQNYIARFNAELYNVDDCEQPFAMTALKAGLLQGLFLHSITKTKSKDHSKLLARANKYILIEDFDETRHKLRNLIEPRPQKKEPKEDHKRAQFLKRLLLK